MSITMIGLDTAKSVFQVHAVDGAGHVVTRRKLRRNELIAFFEKQASCTVVMEACGAAHHWARALTGLGHEVKLIAPEAVRPFVKRGKKNDLAVSRPIMVMLIAGGSLSAGSQRPALWHIDAVGGRPPHLARAAPTKGFHVSRVTRI